MFRRSALVAATLLVVSAPAAPIGGQSGQPDRLAVLISVDMAHAVHPNHADKHEPQHRPVIGGGPVIKVNANQSYASDAVTAGLFASLCARANVTPQHFSMRSDLPCGSTIGPTTAAALGVPTVDLGVAQLSMHSARELAGAHDPARLRSLLAAVITAPD